MTINLSEPQPADVTVLLVGDEPSGLMVSRKILERAGYRVITAAGGHEAAQIYRDRADEITLVILDVIMPQLGGRQVFRLLRRLDHRVNVVMVTGACPSEMAAAVLREGVAAIVQKPYDEQALTAAVRRVLKQSHQAPIAPGLSRRPEAKFGIDEAL